MWTDSRLVQEMKNVESDGLLCCTKFGDMCMIIEQDIRYINSCSTYVVTMKGV